jgi:hypothetical protein
MLLDMADIRCRTKLGNIPIQILHPAMNVRIIESDHFPVCLEEVDVNNVKSDDCHKKSYIRFCEKFPEVEWPFTMRDLQMGFHSIELGKEIVDSPIIGLLTFCEATFA